LSGIKIWSASRCLIGALSFAGACSRNSKAKPRFRTPYSPLQARKKYERLRELLAFFIAFRVRFAM
jgi:hypothetical protein